LKNNRTEFFYSPLKKTKNHWFF